MIIRKICLGITAALLALTTACKDNDVSSTVDTKAFNLEKDMDTSYQPGDNFYMYGNGTWYKNTTIGSTIYDYAGTFHDSDEKIHSDTQKAFAADANGKLFLADLNNMNNTTEAALKSIAAHIHEFDGISTAAEAWAAIGKAKKMGYNPLIDLITYMKGGTVRLLYTWPAQDKMTEDISATSSYLKILGYSEAEATAIANSAKAAKDALASAYSYADYGLNNLEYYPTLNSKLIPIGELSTNGGGMDVVNAISGALSIDNSSNVYIPNDMGNYLDGLHALTPEQIKHVIQCEIAQDYMYSSFTAFSQLNKDGFTYTPESYAQHCLGSKDLAYVSSVLYTKSVVTDALKEEITQVAEDFRTALKTKINSLEWMSSVTKAKAIEKLEAITFWVGKPDKWDETYMPTLTGTSFVEDLRLIRASKFAFSMSLKGASKNDKGMEFEISQNVNMAEGTNSFCDPYLNAMIILPCFMLPPFHDSSYSDALNYANFMSIGHEMTHGFDNLGAQFDKDGNFSNWWTVADKMEFTSRQQNIINCYSNLEISYGNDPFVGIYNNGQRTLQENIADIGGMHLAYSAYMNKLQQEGYCGDELLKQEKKFFLGICYMWREKLSTVRAQVILNFADVHSSAKERVNGMVMNTDRWYELFNVTKDNKLYLPKEKRGDIW